MLMFTAKPAPIPLLQSHGSFVIHILLHPFVSVIMDFDLAYVCNTYPPSLVLYCIDMLCAKYESFGHPSADIRWIAS